MKISIIVPVYNVEPYLETCLDSILAQTYRSLEIILVDDGSSDNCGAVCDEYAARDDRIRVIHKSNGGAASARNAGLDAATGDYIGFVDPDDWIEPDMYEYMLEYALRYQADIVICDIRVLFNGQRVFWLPKIDGVIVQDTAQTIESCLNETMHDGCVNKLYRRALWEGLRFPPYQVAEDLSALWQLYKRTEVSVRLPEDKYVYCRRDGSVTMDLTLRAGLDDFRAIRERHGEVMASWPQFEKLSARRCLESAKVAWELCLYVSREERTAVKAELQEMAEFCAPYLKQYGQDGMGRAGRLQLRLARYYPSGWAIRLAKLINKAYKMVHPAEAAPGNCGSWVAYELTFDQERIKSDSRENLTALDWDLSHLQNSRAYKWYLLGRRISAQLIRGSMAEKKDFFRWVWGKLTRKDNGAKLLEKFDPLVDAKTRVKRAAYLDHMLVQADMLKNTDDTFKQGKQVFIFAGVHYCDVGGGQRSAQLARTLNDMGYSVYYIYYLVHYLFNGPTDPILNGSVWCPAILHYHVDDFSVSALKELLREDALFIFEVPAEKYLPYFEYAVENGVRVVYEHIDNWDSALGEGFYQEAIFRQFVDKAALVTVTARLLGEKIQETVPGKNYLYLPNAVNPALFEPLQYYEPPKDLIRGKKTLLYFGTLYGGWFDWEKVLYVARHCDCEINLIGATDWVRDIDIKSVPSNIHFLGEKKQDTLPAYLAYSDIAILPFKNDEIGKYVSPLKVFEYIAMNKPVLAVPLDDISGYPNVFASDDNEEWVKAVERDWPVVDAGMFTSQNSWYARCSALLEQTNMLPVVSSKISIIVCSQNDKKTIFRCISSLLTFSGRYDCGITVVDSGNDGSYEQLQEQFGTRVKLLKCGKEEAVLKRNQAAEAAEGEYLFFLDGSQWVTSESYLNSALEVLQTGHRIGAVSRSAGRFSKGGYPIRVSGKLPNHGIWEPARLFRTDVAYLDTDGLLIRKTLFEKLEGFDQRYSDIRFASMDLSLKIRHAGYDLALCPYMQLACLTGGTMDFRQTEQAALTVQEKTYFEEKWSRLAPDLLR